MGPGVGGTGILLRSLACLHFPASDTGVFQLLGDRVEVPSLFILYLTGCQA